MADQVEAMGVGELRTLNGMLRAANHVWDTNLNIWVPATQASGGGSGGPVALDTATLAALEVVSIANFPASQVVTDGGGSITVDGTFWPGTQPVSGTFFQATQPVSIASMPSTPVTGPLTDTQLRATAVPVSGTFFQATQPISASALPLPAGASTETTLAALNTKTPAVGQVAMAASSPVVIASDQSAVSVNTPGTTLAVTATAAAAAAVTLTIPAAGAGLKHYISFIEITAYSTAARTGSATPIVVTTTNIPGTPAQTFATAAAIGTTDRYLISPATPIKSNVANTATTIVCPATTGVIWRINAYYYTGV